MPNIELLDPSASPIEHQYPCVAFRADNLMVYAFENRKGMGLAASVAMRDNIRKIVDENTYFNSVWAAAPSQDDVLGFVVEDDRIPWEKALHCGMMDEYERLPASDKRSFRWYHNTHLWGPLSDRGRAPDHNAIRQIKGENPNKDDVLDEYARITDDCPAHIVQGGIGEVNAHIAFNDPPEASFCDSELFRFRKLAQAAKEQQVNEGHYNSVGEVPDAYTLTIPALVGDVFGQGHVVSYWSCVAPTKAKATAAEKMVLGPITEEVPATVLRMLPNAALFLDLQSAHLLHGKEGIDLTPIGYTAAEFENSQE